MKKLILLMTLFLVGCESKTLEETVMNLGDTPKEIISTLGKQHGLELDYSVGILDDAVTFVNEDESYILSLLNEDFYIAVAPYHTNTHPWFYHNATGCSAELKDKEFKVRVITKEGEVIVDEYITSLKNGFFEMWLPRDIEATMIIEYNGLSNISEISTYSGDATCVTTTKLS